MCVDANIPAAPPTRAPEPNNISLEMCYWPRDLDRDPLFVDRDPIPAAREITLS